MKALKSLGLFFVLSSGMAGHVLAGNTWTGLGASGNWTDANNWGGTVPAAGQSIVFAGSTNLTVNQNNSTYGFNNLSFASGAGAFVLGGNHVTIKGGITDSASTSTETINFGGTSSFGTNAAQTIQVVSGGILNLGGSWNSSLAMTTLTMNGGGTTNLSWSSAIQATTLAISGSTTVNLSNSAALGAGVPATSFGAVTVASGSVLQLSNNITIPGDGGLVASLSLISTGVSSKGALENVSGNNTYGGAITLSSASSIGSDANTLTLTGGVTNGGNLLTVVGTGNTTISTTAITGVGGLTKTGAGSLKLSNATGNGYSGATSVNGGTLVVTNTSGSATGTGALSVAATAALAGTGTSSGSSFSISGTTGTGNKASVYVGQSGPTGDNNTTSNLTLIGGSGLNNSTIANANLTFNLDTSSAGGSPGQGNELLVGNTGIAFGSNVTLTLNLLNNTAVTNVPYYVLIAGTVGTSGLGQDGSQYTGLSLGTSFASMGGTLTPILNSGNGGSGNLVLALNTTTLGYVPGSANFYGGNASLYLFQTAGGIDDIIVIPEPSTWALMLGGLAGLAFWQRRKSKQNRL